MLTSKELEELINSKITTDQLLIITRIIEARETHNVRNVNSRVNHSEYMREWRKRNKNKDLVVEREKCESHGEFTENHNTHIENAPACVEDKSYLLTLEEVSKKESKKRKTNKKENSYSQNFEKFWDAYPKNNGSKFECWKKYQATENLGVPFETLYAGAKRYADKCEIDATEIKYIAHGATWLHQRRWEVKYTDEIQKDGYRNGNTTGNKLYDNPMYRMPSVAGG